MAGPDGLRSGVSALSKSGGGPRSLEGGMQASLGHGPAAVRVGYMQRSGARRPAHSATIDHEDLEAAPPARIYSPKDVGRTGPGGYFDPGRYRGNEDE